MADTVPSKAPSLADLMALIVGLNAKIETLEAKVKAAPIAEPVVIGETVYAKGAWEEVIWVEPLMDCTYPDVNDTYSRYRKAAKGDIPADLFRLKHREHLNKYMREIDKGEKLPEPVAKKIPQTSARGRRETAQPF